MSQDEIVAQLVTIRDDAEVRSYLETCKAELSVETIIALGKKAITLTDENPSLALRLSDYAMQMSDYVDDDMAIIEALFDRSNVLSQLGRYEEWYAISEEIIRLGTPLEAWRYVASAHRGQIKPLVESGQMDKALEAARLAKEACAKGGSSCDKVLPLIAMALTWAYRYIGDHEKSLEVALEGLALTTPIHIFYETSLSGQAGVALYELDRYVESEAYLLRADALSRESNNVFNQAASIFQLGQLYRRLGKYIQALDYFEQSRSVVAGIGIDRNVREIDAARAASYLELNLLEEALSLSNDALVLPAAEEQYFQQCELLFLQGAALRRAESYEDALISLEKARNLATTIRREHLLALIQHELAYVFYQLGKSQDARSMLVTIQRSGHLVNSPLLDAKVRVLSARCWLALGDTNSAEADLQQAAQLDAQFNLPSIAIQILYLQGTLHQQNSIRDAYEQFEQSVAKITNQTSNLSLDELRIGYLSDKAEIFSAFIDAAHQRVVSAQLSLGKLWQDVNLTLTAPLGRFATTERGHLSQEDQSRLDSLRIEWNWYQSKLDQVGFASAFRGTSEPIQEDLNTYEKLREIENSLAELLRRQRIRNSAANAMLVHNEGNGELHKLVQAKLAPKQALIHFYIAQGQCHALLMTDKRIDLLSDLVAESDLNQLLMTWRFHIQSVVPMQAEPPLRLAQLYLAKLYDSLCRVVLAKVDDCEHLMLVLPTEWHDLPAAALYDGEQYLIERYRLTHLSTSQALLSELPTTQSGTDRNALVVGYSDGDRLPNTLQESFAVCQELPAYWQAVHLTETEATLAHFRQFCREASLIHLATHAMFRADNPLFSWLRLADKRVTVLDMYDMQLTQRPLVVLSACETGMGKAQGGGVLGMGRGLMAAGASQVVLSRWQLEDAASAELMRHFYQHYDAEKGNAAHALQQAQKATLLKHPHPFLWASYMHIQA